MIKNPISLSRQMKTTFPLAILGIAFMALTACSEQNKESSEVLATPDAPLTTNFDAVYADVSESELRAHIKTLASDEFGGRAPTTEGEKLTIDYLTAELTGAGFAPGNEDSFLQQVDLIKINADEKMTLQMGEQTFIYKENMVASSKREVNTIDVDSSNIVFLGYGVNAPEYEWNDYSKADV